MPDELHYYLSQPPFQQNLHPLQFWKNHLSSTLANIAERLFSLAGFILSDNRDRMTSAYFQQLLFLGFLQLKDWDM